MKVNSSNNALTLFQQMHRFALLPPKDKGGKESMTDKTCKIFHNDHIVGDIFIEKDGKRVPVYELMNVRIAKTFSLVMGFLSYRVFVVAMPIIAFCDGI